MFDIRIDDGSSTGRSFSGEVPVGTNLLVYMSFNLNSPRDLTTSIDVTLDGSIVESITATGPVAEGITSAKRKFKTSHPGMYLANGTVEGLGRDEKSTSVLVVP
ncbi:MAG: hypothetical protein HY336_00800 [Candidatus Doudnabacteria bacterium]|nr:hypothetical protein [Candidatus Doudnabacteria bacterium]